MLCHVLLHANKSICSIQQDVLFLWVTTVPGPVCINVSSQAGAVLGRCAAWLRPARGAGRAFHSRTAGSPLASSLRFEEERKMS